MTTFAPHGDIGGVSDIVDRFFEDSEQFVSDEQCQGDDRTVDDFGRFLEEQVLLMDDVIYPEGNCYSDSLSGDVDRFFGRFEEVLLEEEIVPNVKVKVEPRDEEVVEESEVKFVGGRLSDLEGVLVMTRFEVQATLHHSPRQFAARLRYTLMSDLPLQPPLACGTGFFIEWTSATSDRWDHGVALWRGTDGEFFFFDSLKSKIPSEVQDYLQNQGCSSCHTMPLAIQYPNILSCCYHCIAFVDFVVQNPNIPTRDICYHYPPHKQYNHDVRVVQIFDQI